MCTFIGYSFVGFDFICVLYCFLLLGGVVILGFCVLRKNIKLGVLGEIEVLEEPREENTIKIDLNYFFNNKK